MIASIVREPGNRGAFPESAIVPGRITRPSRASPSRPLRVPMWQALSASTRFP